MRFLQRNIVPIVFLILCSIGFHYSGLSWMFFANDLMTRLAATRAGSALNPLSDNGGAYLQNASYRID